MQGMKRTTPTLLRLLSLWILAASAGLLAPTVAQADEKIIVVVEKSDNEDDETNHESNCEGLPAGAEKVEAGSLEEAVDGVNDHVGEKDCVKELHFRGHGSPGNQSVGDGVNHEAGKRINGHKEEWEDELDDINFCDDATIHLWGCNSGAGEDGACKLQEIADCTGATAKGPTNTVYAGDQEDYDGPICEATPGGEKPDCPEADEEKAKKKPKSSEDVGCATTASAENFGYRDGLLNTEDVGCDGIAGTFDFGEGDGLLNTKGTSRTACLSGPGEDLGCDNVASTGDAGEGDGLLNTEDLDGDRELAKETVSTSEPTDPTDPTDPTEPAGPATNEPTAEDGEPSPQGLPQPRVMPHPADIRSTGSSGFTGSTDPATPTGNTGSEGPVISTSISCEDFTKPGGVFDNNCPPEVGSGVENTCYGCAIAINNCWKNCGDPAYCDGQEDGHYPAEGEPQGDNTCPHDRCWYISGGCYTGGVTSVSVSALRDLSF